MSTNPPESLFKDAFGSGKTDHRNDFVDAIQEAMNFDSRNHPEELPPLFPTPSRIQDRDPTLPTDAQETQSQFDSSLLEAKYQRFDLSDPLDVKCLEEVNNKVLKQGWLLAREEWVHTKNGGSYVILKYLVNHKQKDKDNTKREPLVGPSGSQSEPV